MKLQLNEIREIIYSLYRVKEITRKLFHNIINLIKLCKIMDTIFVNSENSKTSNPHRLLLNVSDKIVSKSNYEYIVLSNLSIYYTWKNMKKVIQKNKFKISAPTMNETF